MQKKLMVLFIFAIFVLLVGWSITPVQAHTDDPCPHKEGHHHCGNGEPPPPDDGKVVAEYSVDITGAETG